MSPSSRFDHLSDVIDELHRDAHRDHVKYLLLHPMANGYLGVKAEHPARNEAIVGRGKTWLEAAHDCLRQVQELEAADVR